MLEACGATDVVRVTRSSRPSRASRAGWTCPAGFHPPKPILPPSSSCRRPGRRLRPDLPPARRDGPGRPRLDGQGGADARTRGRAPGGMGESRGVSLDVAAARARFTALRRDLVSSTPPVDPRSPTR
jgi:hypothetical protein